MVIGTPTPIHCHIAIFLPGSRAPSLPPTMTSVTSVHSLRYILDTLIPTHPYTSLLIPTHHHPHPHSSPPSLRLITSLTRPAPDASRVTTLTNPAPRMLRTPCSSTTRNRRAIRTTRNRRRHLRDAPQLHYVTPVTPDTRYTRYTRYSEEMLPQLRYVTPVTPVPRHTRHSGELLPRARHAFEHGCLSLDGDMDGMLGAVDLAAPRAASFVDAAQLDVSEDGSGAGAIKLAQFGASITPAELRRALKSLWGSRREPYAALLATLGYDARLEPSAVAHPVVVSVHCGGSASLRPIAFNEEENERVQCEIIRANGKKLSVGKVRRVTGVTARSSPLARCDA